MGSFIIDEVFGKSVQIALSIQSGTIHELLMRYGPFLWLDMHFRLDIVAFGMVISRTIVNLERFSVISYPSLSDS